VAPATPDLAAQLSAHSAATPAAANCAPLLVASPDR